MGWSEEKTKKGRDERCYSCKKSADGGDSSESLWDGPWGQGALGQRERRLSPPEKGKKELGPSFPQGPALVPWEAARNLIRKAPLSTRKPAGLNGRRSMLQGRPEPRAGRSFRRLLGAGSKILSLSAGSGCCCENGRGDRPL